MSSKRFYSNGKLLISGEYVVLDGALALAVPTKLGQSLIVEPINEPKIIWKSFDNHGKCWFKNEFCIPSFTAKTNKGPEVSKRLIQILKAIKNLNPKIFNGDSGYSISTHLDFPRDWGLGTSSTLINNLAQWANIDPYILLEQTFGGSGYDIACAKNNSPITYQIENKPISNMVDFNPKFKDQLYFVHLNKKQNSRVGIKNYNNNKGHLNKSILEINKITKEMIICNHFTQFEDLLDRHEQTIADVTKQTPIKQLLFSDFNGTIKSLGAWGGDFILASSKEDPTPYFKNKGYLTVIPYNEMVLG